MNATAYTPAAASKVEPKDGVLPEDMYRVGKDLPAGTYKVRKKGTDSYVEITSTSTRAENDTIAYETIKDEKEITVKDGQYLRMSSARTQTKVTHRSGSCPLLRAADFLCRLWGRRARKRRRGAAVSA